MKKLNLLMTSVLELYLCKYFYFCKFILLYLLAFSFADTKLQNQLFHDFYYFQNMYSDEILLFRDPSFTF